ncbi:kinase-like domain-containing protein [Mycena rebaudengoi]|nr:kinase-like domain-containing protein [Mycena rebaudengoi]
MAEIVAGFAGATTTLAAARAATSAGFTGRHESSHRTELAEVDRNVHRYRSAFESSGSEIYFRDEDDFRRKLNASQERLDEYYETLNRYKDESWFNLPAKIKKRREVRKQKRAARDANHDLRVSVDKISRASSEHRSNISSVYAESGSPPGSRMERERIESWIDSTCKVVIDDFEMVRVLGKGCAGKVLLVKHKTTADLYALKAITKRYVLAHQELQHTLTEQAVLKRMTAESKDPFVVKLWWSFQDKEHLFLVMDFHPGGDLATQLARWGRLGRDRARFYATEIVEGVEGLHAAGVIYRDLKPENILIGSDGHIVLTDFGCSKEFPRRTAAITTADTTTTFCGTAEYLAPEVIQGLAYSYEVDWWSFGTMLYEMLIGITPFWANNHSDMYVRVLQDELQFPEDRAIDQDAKSLIRAPPTESRSQILWAPDKTPSLLFYDRLVPSPYIPPIDPSNASDTQNFDGTFLDMEPVLDDANEDAGTRMWRMRSGRSRRHPRQEPVPELPAQQEDAIMEEPRVPEPEREVVPVTTTNAAAAAAPVAVREELKPRKSKEQARAPVLEKELPVPQVPPKPLPPPGEVGCAGAGPDAKATEKKDEEDDDWDFGEAADGEDRNGAKGSSLFARGVDRYRLAVFRKPSTPSRSFSGISRDSEATGKGTEASDSPSPSQRRGRTPGLMFRKHPWQFLRPKSLLPSSYSSKSSLSGSKQ